jgi:hypothetical protein
VAPVSPLGFFLEGSLMDSLYLARFHTRIEWMPNPYGLDPWLDAVYEVKLRVRVDRSLVPAVGWSLEGDGELVELDDFEAKPDQREQDGGLLFRMEHSPLLRAEFQEFARAFAGACLTETLGVVS